LLAWSLFFFFFFVSVNFVTVRCSFPFLLRCAGIAVDTTKLLLLPERCDVRFFSGGVRGGREICGWERDEGIGERERTA
jgi:hypothetical protein